MITSVVADVVDEKVSFGARMAQLAVEHPDKSALIFLPESGEDRIVTWRELDHASTCIAHLLRDGGVNENSIVVIGLKNCPEHFFAAHAAWKLGALVLPVSYRLPRIERDQILELAKPTVAVADWNKDEIAFPVFSFDDLRTAIDRLAGVSLSYPDNSLPNIVAHPGKAIGSGGSTGRSKIIVNPGPWAFAPGEIESKTNPMTGFRSGQTQIVAGPLYHNSPFSWGHFGLFEDQIVVLLERFNAETVVDAIERYRVNFGFFSPTMMQRIVQIPDIHKRDFSSIEAMFHTAAPCPDWLKRAWMKLIPPHRVYEGFGSTEDVGSVWIRGDDWLEHPGSVGKPFNCDLRIVDEDGREVAPGQVGEIFTRPRFSDQSTYYYIGSAPASSTPDGFVSVGDMGWLDDDGYLHLADRRVDMIVTGGANVYPAEVEAALSSHPQVIDVAVVGVPDPDWGKRVHAIIQARDQHHPPEVADLNGYVRERLTSYKVPKTYEFVTEFPRDPSGKLRRTRLVADRSSGDIAFIRVGE